MIFELVKSKKNNKISCLNDGRFLFILFHMKRFWHKIQFWIEHHLTLSHFRVVKTAFDGYAYDWSYLLRLEQAKLKEIKSYFETQNKK